MKELTTEEIEIGGKTYTLFLNRKGLVSFEKITKLSKRTEELEKKYKAIIEMTEDDKPIEVKDNDNPYDYVEDSEMTDTEKDILELKEIYVKFYWIALYEKHKLPLSEVSQLFDKAEEEYGIEQLILLANQIIDEVNEDKYGNIERKKLKALHQQN